jgi:hypothetical protein
MVGGKPLPKSEITEKDGTVWVITEVSSGAGEFHFAESKKKDEPKKN